jgi:ADP-ribose pyrophosphatase YjhB (NUDIX family)
MYAYTEPMFRITVSVVVFVENRVAMVKGTVNRYIYRFPTTTVKAGGETIQFAAVRRIKEDTGIVLLKEALIPVDFRTTPKEYVESMNAVDIGMTCLIDSLTLDEAKEKIPEGSNLNWYEVDFENKVVNIGDKDLITKQYYMDHKLLFDRAIDIVLMVRD